MNKTPDPSEPSVARPLSAKDIQGLYNRGENVMAYFRELAGTTRNNPEAIMISYDLQSGCDIRAMSDVEYSARFGAYTAAIAKAIDPLPAKSFLEAGVGDAKTLCDVVAKLQTTPEHVFGVDLAWSRIAFGRDYGSRFDTFQPRLSTGDMFALPFADNTFDVIFTAQAVNPNHGREEEALRELYRVARRWLVLVELDYELGGEETKRRIEQHGYCRDLAGAARRLGYHVREHRLLGVDLRPTIQVGVLIVEKPCADSTSPAPDYACPRCHQGLLLHQGNYFCKECLTVFPVINGIPCLLSGNGVLATRYLEF